MIDNSDIYSEIEVEYQNIRKNNEVVYEQTKKQIYFHFPRIEEIDNQLENAALDSCKEILSGSVGAKEAVERMKTKTQRLVAERNEILKSAGLPVDCLDEIYNCPLCKDSGWKDGKRCDCYYDKLRDVMQKKSNMGAADMKSFEKFDISVYSPQKNSEYNISPRENAQNIFEIAKEFAEGNGKPASGLLFYGGTGLGKTFTSECIAREFIKNGRTVFYSSSPKLFSLFEDYKFGRNTTDEVRRAIKFVSDAELLIIDDLGTEFRTQYVDSILFDIINTRTRGEKYMIISTNLTPGQIEKTYSPRISSRILGSFETVLFFGDDLRLSSR